MTDLFEQADQPRVEYTPTPSKHTLSRLGKLRGPYRMKRPFIEQPEDPAIRYIALTQGQYAIVDTHLYDWLMQWNWYARFDKTTGGYYVVRNSETVNRKKGIVSMHAQIMGEDKVGGRLRDHANRIATDNRGSNLRWALPNQSATNTTQPARKAARSSKFRGVHSHPDGVRWISQIMHMGIKISLGTFVEEIEAARTYDANAIKLHGSYAMLNFPISTSLD